MAIQKRVYHILNLTTPLTSAWYPSFNNEPECTLAVFCLSFLHLYKGWKNGNVMRYNVTAFPFLQSGPNISHQSFCLAPPMMHILLIFPSPGAPEIPKLAASLHSQSTSIQLFLTLGKLAYARNWFNQYPTLYTITWQLACTGNWYNHCPTLYTTTWQFACTGN